MKKIAVFIFAFALSACMTNRKGELTTKGMNFLNDHCKGSDSISHSDNTTILFDTVKVPVYTQGPIQYITSPCDSLGKLKLVNVTKKFNGITGTIKTVGNSLVFDCFEDSLKMIIETQKRVITDFEKSKIVIQEPCKKEHVTGTQWFFIRAGQWLLIFLALQVIIRAVVAFYPVTKPFLYWAYFFKF